MLPSIFDQVPGLRAEVKRWATTNSEWSAAGRFAQELLDADSSRVVEVPLLILNANAQEIATLINKYKQQQMNQTAKVAEDKKPSALDVQIGGSHYNNKGIQPVVYIHANKLNFLEGCIVKRITRWREKAGIEDLKKIKHEIDLLIELEGLTDKTDGAKGAP